MQTNNYMAHKIIIIYLFFQFIVYNGYSQIKYVDIYKRSDAYDYFIFGVTNPKLKNLRQIAGYYNIKLSDLNIYNNPTDVSQVNIISDETKHYLDRELYDSILLQKGQIILMPPFTYNPKENEFNIDCKSIKLAENDTIYTIKGSSTYKMLTTQESKPLYALDKYYHRPHTLYEIQGEEDSQPTTSDTLYVLDKIILKNNVTVYRILARDRSLVADIEYIYICREDKLISFPLLISYNTSRNVLSISSKIFLLHNGSDRKSVV